MSENIRFKPEYKKFLKHFIFQGKLRKCVSEVKEKCDKLTKQLIC